MTIAAGQLILASEILAIRAAATEQSSIQTLGTSYLPVWAKARGAVLAGSANAVVHYLGDSTIVGYGAPGSLTAVGARPMSPPYLMGKLIAASGTPCTAEGFIADQNVGLNSITVAQYDTRIVLGAGWSYGGVSSGTCGGILYNTTTTNAVDFTPVGVCDTIQVFYNGVSGTAGIGSVAVDGGASLGTFNTNATSATHVATFTCTRGSHTVNLSRVSGSVYLLGAFCYDSTIPSVHLYACGGCGYEAKHYTNEVFSGWNYPQFVGLVPPDLTIIELTINDAVLGTTPSAYQISMQALITQAKTSGDVILVVGVQTSISVTLLAVQQAIWDKVYTLAASNNVPLLDMTQRWSGGYEGLFGAQTYASDGIHANAGGYGDKARFVASALLT